jgi:hypothetical protein
MTEKYYAHSLEGKPPSDWQLLDEHLNNVAEMARSFARAFGAGDWAYMAGLKKRLFSGASAQRYYRWGGAMFESILLAKGLHCQRLFGNLWS